MKKRSFDWRSLITFSVAISAFVLFVSGIILYIAPSGRVAYWTNWKILLGKEEWTDIHVTFSILFTVVILFHVFNFNWRAFKHFLKRRYLALAIALGISAVFFVGTYFYVPPLNYVREFSNYMKDYWERKTAPPPTPHAEELTLKRLAKEVLKISPERALEKLKKNGIKVNGVEEIIKDIGKRNNKSPQEIFDLFGAGIVEDEREVVNKEQLGNKTLRDVALEIGIRGRDAVEILRNKGLKVYGGFQRLKDIAKDNGIAPEKLYKILKGER